MIPEVSYENELAGLAAAFIRNLDVITSSESALVKHARAPTKAQIASVMHHTKCGTDILGEMFCTLRSPEMRRIAGATYTPSPIVDAMIQWAKDNQPPDRVIDPGAGSGRFALAAAKAFTKALIVAVETDPLARLLIRANASISGCSDRVYVNASDFRRLKLRRIEGVTLFLGNPPYIRHHDITKPWKTWFSSLAKTYSLPSSELAGLHIHFFLKTRELARPGDHGAYITSSEWVDVNYGSIL